MTMNIGRLFEHSWVYLRFCVPAQRAA